MRPLVVLVTDPAFGDESTVRRVAAAAAAVPPGTLCVQLRDKQRARASLRAFACQLRVMTRRVGVGLVVNADVELARDVGADGVHLPAGGPAVPRARGVLGGRAWVSVPAHSDDDVASAAAHGADAVLVSPIFPTRSSSPGGVDHPKMARGMDALRAARRIAPPGLAIYALGGVDETRAWACAVAGAHGVAVRGAVLGSVAPARVVRAIHDSLTRRW
ncbi:MAG TPA: thiamine phosphate synthase [Polyangiaceae bacterium]|nr:thiamine phosphate synthase [Polyangiaceae bacterium]